MNPLHSVGARLGLALAVVVGAALALVDLIVVPSLQRNLVHAKIAQLRDAAPAIARQYEAPSTQFNTQPFLQSASESASARISVFDELGTNTLMNVDDSHLGPETGPEDLSTDALAEQAARTGKVVSGEVKRDGRQYAEVALPLLSGRIMLMSASLRDSLGNINLVRRRLMIAGVIALAASLLVGYAAASIFARRLRRLERAADRIAGGDFSEPVSDPGSDEVGQLAEAFERMRQRLAGLERARREFIANASHELRTPLFSLGGFLELLENEDLDPATQAEFLHAMREQIDRLQKLATELLDLSRLDAGRMHVEAEPLDLAAIAQSLAQEFHPVALASGHDIRVENGSPATAVGDEERARQIGRILLENALVHTPRGTTIRMTTTRRDGKALLEVQDDGPGIAPADQPHVFDRFYRVEGSVASGSGLGLAIARELAGVMGGAVELSSAPGRTAFGLSLPVAHREDSGISRENDAVPAAH
jgi:signal transduction histidine kinase